MLETIKSAPTTKSMENYSAFMQSVKICKKKTRALKWSLPMNNMHENPTEIIPEKSICDPYRLKFSRLMPVLPKKAGKSGNNH